MDGAAGAAGEAGYLAFVNARLEIPGDWHQTQRARIATSLDQSNIEK